MSEHRPIDADAPTVTETDGRSLAVDQLVEAVHGRFSQSNRERISRDVVRRVIEELPLQAEDPSHHTPLLRVLRLRFCGEKRLHDQQPTTFVYDQEFAPGVNVICIPQNEVGKSSILKTIKYALTGDDGDYDVDIRNWIADVWLAFSLDRHEYTVLISKRAEEVRSLLVAGREFRPLAAVAESASLAVFDVMGAAAIKDELERFFFLRLGLESRGWTQEDGSAPRGVAERGTSWLTYFQAVHIPDDGDRYLLCDPQHSIGNQDGLILSEFLGLHLREPLNRLGVEAARAKKEARYENQIAAAKAEEASALLEQLSEDLRSAQEELEEIDSALMARRRAVEGGEPAAKLIAVQSALAENASEQSRLMSERDQLSQSLRQRRALARRAREAVAFRLHFTGLEVSLCPNCDATVEQDAVRRESADHLCRLCGKHAQGADPVEVAAMEAYAADIEAGVTSDERDRDEITATVAALRRDQDQLTAEEANLREAAGRGLTYALPTDEENSRRSDLQERVGHLKAEIDFAQQRAERRSSDEEDTTELHVRVVEKVREVLRAEAEQRNRDVLCRLSVLTQDVTRRIGAESITDMSCSALGAIKLKKHDENVSFSRIQNEGERLRVKLAFFLAMMRLGREPGPGRHPGILLIDQPGSGEMVPGDFEVLAEVFHRIDAELADQVQIICFTARPQFRAATDATKVYGPQAPPYAF